ncbi:MAG TPA: phosphoenolpyruvate synthase [Bdellovibrionales bacterium]|nr:MAG: phosphoenolpyruvate synthase [Bdellovibrionales bacterium GWB1_52_6]OFZ03174.1 MAG: phosphoenolpyruvate synthase [Bdellovibrionales bacterium GWA1_52_35]HAR42538.1 phosphoenolpyruvate synthase [Bdellovibrionales bacterium]HCM38332.1 phosphoenolpyruvate synthase [Bdellovibrionales bacterium]
MDENKDRKFIRWFKQLNLNDVGLVGGKNASLGEMLQTLSAEGIRVPNGFAVTADAYWHFLRKTGLIERIDALLGTLDKTDVEALRSKGNQVRQLILGAVLPGDLRAEIEAAYQELTEIENTADVAVRSSATAEDLPQASFAGQQETYLNVQGPQPLLEACRRCFASLFTDRAISYRADMGFDYRKVGLSIGIQRMVRADLACSGVMFSLDTESGFRDVVLINAAYGLGENIVQGAVNPDEIYVFKPTLKAGFRPILQKKTGTKELRMIYDIGGAKMVKNIPVPLEERRKLAITDDEILLLSNWACLVEAHYTKRAGHPVPVDMEWAKDGRTGELFIVQARPETIHAQKKTPDFLEIYDLKEKPKPLLTGRSVGEKIAHGRARVIHNIQELGRLRPGEILVTDKTDPDWEPVMKLAGGVITNRGGRTCHAAIVSRELGLAAVVGTERGTELLQTGQEITVSCGEGDTGMIYPGHVPFETRKVALRDLKKPRTKIMMNLADPEVALRMSLLPNDGVGLARMEFVITHSIRVHPMALLHFAELTEKPVRSEIEELTREYPKKEDYFVDRLAQGIGMIAAAFYPKDVIVRMSDFKTNEYANLLGGRQFEPHEENPMLGFRGASRYYHPRYREAFSLECRAMKKVRTEMGLDNLKLMIPFCRTTEEGRRVLVELVRNGLRQGENGLEVYVMCEIPSNVILAEEFSEIFDGFSIGSNDLTQLILGVDRDSEIVAPVFDERNPAVKAMIKQVIQTAKARGRKIGICGQAPSDYPDFASYLVQAGIDSISLNPDSLLKTTLTVTQEEDRIANATAA